MHSSHRPAHRFFVPALILALAGMAPAAFGQNSEGVLREGEGARRAQLNQSELKPFPDSAWSTLSAWKDGKALSPADIAGKPVLIMTWSSWHPSGAKAIAAARRVEQSHAKDGLILVVVHHPEGFADASAEMAKPAGEGEVIYFAHDAKGDFRRQLFSDQDPDFYVIDRAGQLRFGDVVTESVARACQIICEETRDQAAGLNQQLADSRADAQRAALKSGGIRDQANLASIPEQTFTMPADSVFKAVRWPKAPRTDNSNNNLPEAEDPKLTLPETGLYYPSRPQTKGRGVVLYFWSPTNPRTYQGVIDRMDRIQRAGGRDLAVIGVISPSDDKNAPLPDPTKVDPDWSKMIRGRNLQHSMLQDLTGAMMAQVTGLGGATTIPLPYAAVVSSDGTVRFAGRSTDSAFQAAVDAIINLDPGVKARRAAEEEYLKSVE